MMKLLSSMKLPEGTWRMRLCSALARALLVHC